MVCSPRKGHRKLPVKSNARVVRGDDLCHTVVPRSWSAQNPKLVARGHPRGRAHAILKVLDAELVGREWIAADRPTIADVALYSYIARAPEGNVDLSAYANVKAWLGRIEALPGFVEFGVTPVGLAA